jgi:hypothetical protein
MQHVPEPTRSAPGRPDTPDVLELKALKAKQPELADAVDLQLALLEIHRRVQLRIPLPSLGVSAARVTEHVTARRPLLAYADVPAEPGTLRLVLRQTGEVLNRFGLIEPDAHTRLQALARDGDVAAEAEAWFVRSCEGRSHAPGAGDDADQAMGLALKPFLSRCADAVQPAPALAVWTLNTCAVCGGEAEFGVVESADVRRLICGQCRLHGSFAPDRCPFCPHTGRARLTTFTTPDRRYQLTACEVCRRYLKSYRSQPGQRPGLAAVDTLATLPLDAAAIQRGYGG